MPILMSIIAEKGFVFYQLHIKCARLYSEITEAIYMYLAKSYRDGIKVAYLKSCLYKLKHSCQRVVFTSYGAPTMKLVQYIELYPMCASD
jgi:hypothetical protein